MKTSYRVVNDGFKEDLQYLHEYRILGLFSVRRWRYVWRPYYDKIYGRSLDEFRYDTYVNNRNCHIRTFTEKWSDINNYFEWAKKEQARLENNVAIKKAEVCVNKGKIEYL